jgi:non-specific serine/threonine protein kinase
MRARAAGARRVARGCRTEGGGPLALLLDRLGSVGPLPALPGVGALAARVAGLEGEHTREMTEPILRDMALSLNYARLTAPRQGTQVTGNGLR